jgi:hypothetical protein
MLAALSHASRRVLPERQVVHRACHSPLPSVIIRVDSRSWWKYLNVPACSRAIILPPA